MVRSRVSMVDAVGLLTKRLGWKKMMYNWKPNFKTGFMNYVEDFRWDSVLKSDLDTRTVYLGRVPTFSLCEILVWLGTHKNWNVIFEHDEIRVVMCWLAKAHLSRKRRICIQHTIISVRKMRHRSKWFLIVSSDGKKIKEMRRSEDEKL